MIDLATLNRNLKDCIQQLPTQARHKGREKSVWLNATVDVVQALDGGTLDNMNMVVVGARADFGSVLPKSMDDFELLITNQWIMFQVASVPDYFDGPSPLVTINLQSSNKGIG